MHLLHVVQRYAPYVGGSERYFQEISEHMAAQGHRVTLLTTDAYDLEHFWAPHKRRVEQPTETLRGVQVIRLPVRRAPGPPIIYPIIRRLMVELGRLPGTAPLLRRLALLTPRLPALVPLLNSAALRDVALVHTTNITLDFAIIPVARWAAQRGIPHVITPFVHLGVPGDHTVLRYYSMRHQIDLLRSADAVIVQTPIEHDFLAAAGVPAARLHTIGVGISPSELAGGDGARFRAQHQITGRLVLFIGSMAYDKGAMHSVQALERLRAAGREVTLALIGSTVLADFERFYAGLPASLQASCRVLRSAAHQVKLDALAAADLLVLPSRTDSFGIVLMEAWHYGLPVVAARAGGLPAVVRDGIDGLLVPFGDLPALAGAIGRLLDNRELAQRLGAAGHDRVARELTWEHKVARVSAVYAGLERTAS